MHSNDRLDLISGNEIIDDDIAYALGRFTLAFVFDGQLEVKGNDYIISQFGGVYYRIWDSFDFIGQQSLGRWKRDVFSPIKPTVLYYNTSVTNETFRSYYHKITGSNYIQDCQDKVSWNFNAITKYISISNKINKDGFKFWDTLFEQKQILYKD